MLFCGKHTPDFNVKACSQFNDSIRTCFFFFFLSLKYEFAVNVAMISDDGLIKCVFEWLFCAMFCDLLDVNEILLADIICLQKRKLGQSKKRLEHSLKMNQSQPKPINTAAYEEN